MENKLRIDYLSNHIDYKVVQHKDMYHFNTDTCLLGEFINIKKNDTVLDVGTNNGALLVYIIKKGGIATGIEINAKALEICKLTLKENNINATLIDGDFTCYSFKSKFDCIVSNPPYFTFKDKQTNKNENKNIARHENSLTIESLCKALKQNLKENCVDKALHSSALLKTALYSKNNDILQALNNINRNYTGDEELKLYFIFKIPEKDKSVIYDVSKIIENSIKKFLICPLGKMWNIKEVQVLDYDTAKNMLNYIK